MTSAVAFTVMPSVPVTVSVAFAPASAVAGGVATGGTVHVAGVRRRPPCGAGSESERSGIAEIPVRVTPDRHASSRTPVTVSAAIALVVSLGRGGQEQAGHSNQQKTTMFHNNTSTLRPRMIKSMTASLNRD